MISSTEWIGSRAVVKCVLLLLSLAGACGRRNVGGWYSDTVEFEVWASSVVFPWAVVVRKSWYSILHCHALRRHSRVHRVRSGLLARVARGFQIKLNEPAKDFTTMARAK